MLTPTRWPARAAYALLGFGIAAACSGTASAQSVFNPYMPYNADLFNYVAPIMPNNLALPGAAREAAAYSSEASYGSVSRYNTFDRWLNDYESDVARGRRSASGGSASPDRSDLNRYIPNRDADRRFYRDEDLRTRDYFSEESERARIAVERDRYYSAAYRVTDPARHAAYLKVVARLSDPKTATATLREIDEAKENGSRPAPAPAPAPTGRRGSAATPAAPLGRSVLSNPAFLGPRATPGGAGTPGRAATPSTSVTGTTPASENAGRPASPASTTATPSNRGASIVLPDSRPPSPTETRGRTARPSGPAPLPSSGGSAPAAPGALPDDLPPPPR